MQFTPPPSNPPNFDKDRRLRVRWRVIAIVAGVATVVLAQVFDAAPGIVDRVYSDGVGPWIGLTLAKLSNLAPFSVVEMAAGLVLLRAVGAVGGSLWHVARRRRRLSNALACGLLKGGTAAALIVSFFYAGWGFSFSRPKMIARLGWQSYLDTKANDELADELARMCDGLARAANDEYMRSFNSQDIGEPTKPPMTMAELDSAIEDGYKLLTLELNLKPHFAVARGPIKPALASPLMSRLLILGFYSPWTGESHYNTQMPGCNLPQVIAHEKAHQRCITSEDEANFFGVLACVLSDVPYIRYSGFLAAQEQLLNELYDLDPARAREIAREWHPGVKRDRKACSEFAMKNLGKLSQAGRAVNDAYLKANRVKEGVMSYDMDTQLLIAFTRVYGTAWYDSRIAGSEAEPVLAAGAA